MAAPDNHYNILDGQARLSGHLQLLDQFRHSDRQVPYRGAGEYINKRSRDRDANTDIRLLDTIAVALTTGKSGDAFAAAFDRRQHLTLVLAKNDHHTDEDDQAVRRLITVLIDSATTSGLDVFPFLFSRCGENIERRMKKMVEALTSFSRSLDEVLKDYTPALSVEEFPGSEKYRQKWYRDGEPPFPEMMRDLLAKITQAAQAFDAQDFDVSKKSYMTLAVLVPILQKTRLPRSLCDVTNSMHLRCDLHWQAARLNRRLAKVSQYYHGINHLIQHAKRYFPRGTDHHWVGEITGTGEGMVGLGEHYLAPIEQALGNRLSAEDLARLDARLPNLDDNWRNNRVLQTRLHPEIRIVLHLSNSSDALARQGQQPIGCSKRSCLCCTLWIAEHNKIFGTKWRTSGSHGKSYATWALPGCSYAHARERGGRSIVDETVVRRVELSLTHWHSLHWLFPPMSGSEPESGSDSDEIDMDGPIRAWYFAKKERYMIGRAA